MSPMNQQGIGMYDVKTHLTIFCQETHICVQVSWFLDDGLFPAHHQGRDSI